MPIPFTQFLMPDGRQKQIVIDRPHCIETKAQALIKIGCRFEIEMLNNGIISMECLSPYEVLTGALANNNEEVPEAVDRLVEEAWEMVSHELNPS